MQLRDSIYRHVNDPNSFDGIAALQGNSLDLAFATIDIVSSGRMDLVLTRTGRDLIYVPLFSVLC